MATSSFRPKYVPFDCHGTLISFDIDPTTRRVLPYEQIIQNSFDGCASAEAWRRPRCLRSLH